jgi:hypothetical protein
MINLLPTDYKENIQYGRKNSKVLSWLTAVIFGIVILLLTALVGQLTIRASIAQVSSQKTDLENKLKDSSAAKTEASYNDFITGISNVKKIYQQQILYSRLIRKLGTLLPPGTKLTTISLADKDRAINLNFSNDEPGLGPTIQINLENQGDQIAKLTRSAFTNAFATPIGGAADEQDKNQAVISVNQTAREIVFDLSIKDNPNGDKLKSIQNGLKNGGEFAYELAKISLGSKLTSDASTPKETPKFDHYSVDATNKRVDMYFGANSIKELEDIKTTLNKSSFQPFIETYLYENTDFLASKECTPIATKDKKSCKLICPTVEQNCATESLICVPTINHGCQYVIRGYYDELYTSATIVPINDKDRAQCAFDCTHKVTAKYSEMFEKVDINRVSACTRALATNVYSCPVEMRAEFGANSKFYLANTGAATK